VDPDDISLLIIPCFVPRFFNFPRLQELDRSFSLYRPVIAFSSEDEDSLPFYSPFKLAPHPACSYISLFFLKPASRPPLIQCLSHSPRPSGCLALARILVFSAARRSRTPRSPKGSFHGTECDNHEWPFLRMLSSFLPLFSSLLFVAGLLL